jgi:hypothetical protein
MIKKNNNSYYTLIFLLTIFIFILKYIYTFFFFKNDFLISKILLETTDNQYYPLVESLSRFNFSPSYNNYFFAKKIITFPFLSLIWHAILFKFINYYTFIVLEFFFKYLTFLVLYKIFNKLDFNFISAIFFSFLILASPSYFHFIGLLDLKYIGLIKDLIDSQIGYRFPRPLVTFFYLNLFLYFVISYFHNDKNNKKYILLFLSLILAFLANSFFYLFISCSFLLFLLVLISFKKEYFFLKKNKFLLFCSILVVLIGLLIVLLQNFYGETDYSKRIGVFEINYEQKIFLFKYFILSFLKPEILFLFLFCFIIKFSVKKFFFKKSTIIIMNVFFYLFISSIISPFVFVFLSPKIIALYHFFDLIIFAGIYFILFSLFVLFYYRYRLTFFSSLNIYFGFSIIFLTIFLSSILIANKVDQREDLNLINSYLLKNNISGTNKILLTNDIKIINLWLHHRNKYLSVPEAFSNSLTDSQIEESLFLVFKSLNVSNKELENFLKLKTHDGRNFFSLHLYNYKYQANSLKTFSSLDNYSSIDKSVILKTSPLRVTANIVPQNEIRNMLNKYKNLKSDIKYLPDLIILDKNFPINFNSKFFVNTLNTKQFILYKRI